jgi:Skp family chaperone for outer membrane proteins
MRLHMMVAVIGFMAVAAAAGETKIAVVNGSRVLKEYYKTELADTHIQQQLDDFSAERDKLLAEHRKIKQEFEALRAEAQNKMLTDEARDRKREQAEEKLAEVIEYESTIRDKAASRKKQIEGEGRKIHSELAKAVKSAAQACANKGGYTIVLESGGMLANGLEAVLYADPAMDITDDVIRLLNAGKKESKE